MYALLVLVTAGMVPVDSKVAPPYWLAYAGIAYSGLAYEVVTWQHVFLAAADSATATADGNRRAQFPAASAATHTARTHPLKGV